MRVLKIDLHGRAVPSTVYFVVDDWGSVIVGPFSDLEHFRLTPAHSLRLESS